MIARKIDFWKDGLFAHRFANIAFFFFLWRARGNDLAVLVGQTFFGEGVQEHPFHSLHAGAFFSRRLVRCAGEGFFDFSENAEDLLCGVLVARVLLDDLFVSAEDFANGLRADLVRTAKQPRPHPGVGAWLVP